jgi:hypothetical protein
VQCSRPHIQCNTNGIVNIPATHILSLYKATKNETRTIYCCDACAAWLKVIHAGNRLGYQLLDFSTEV